MVSNAYYGSQLSRVCKQAHIFGVHATRIEVQVLTKERGVGELLMIQSSDVFVAEISHSVSKRVACLYKDLSPLLVWCPFCSPLLSWVSNAI